MVGVLEKYEAVTDLLKMEQEKNEQLHYMNKNLRDMLKNHTF